MNESLTYRPHAHVEDLLPGQCTLHRAGTADGKRWWLLWFYVFRDDKAGVLEDFAVPVNPGGGYAENGPGGRTWGLTRAGEGVWQIAPSINVLAGRVVAGSHPEESIWHHTPSILGVPEKEPWQ